MTFIRSLFWGLFSAGLFTIIAPSWLILYLFMFLGFFAFAGLMSIPIVFFLDWLEVRSMR